MKVSRTATNATLAAGAALVLTRTVEFSPPPVVRVERSCMALAVSCIISKVVPPMVSWVWPEFRFQG